MLVDRLLLPALFFGLLLVLLKKISGNINSTSSGRSRRRGRPLIQTAVNPSKGASTAAPHPAGSGLFSASSFYRLKDGSGDYQFRFQESADGPFQVYILQSPRSKNGPDSGSPHVLQDAGGQYICWSVSIEDYADAKEIAARWAEATEKWHKTGKTF